MSLESTARSIEPYYFDTVFSFFEKTEDFLKYLKDQTYNNLDSSKDREDSFYGYPKDTNLSGDDYFKLKNVLDYYNPAELDTVRNVVELIKNEVDLGGDFDKSRIKTSSLPIGVFNFGLASKGLIRKVEYYDYVNDFLIDDKNVESKKNAEGKTIFFYRNFEDEEIEIQPQQSGTYYVKKLCKDVEVKLDERINLHVPFKDGKIYNGCGTKDAEGNVARLKYATTTKKVYMYKSKLGGGLNNYAEIYLNVGGLYDLTSEQMLLINVPSLILAEFLDRAGVKVRITAFRCYTYDSKTISLGFGIKDYNEPLNLSRIASMTSDVRFFRGTLWNQTSALRGMKTKDTSLRGLGTTVYASESKYQVIFNMYRNWLLNSKKLVGFNTKVDNPFFMIAGGMQVSSYDKITKPLSANLQERIEKKTFELLDYYGILLTKNPRRFIEKLADRNKKLYDMSKKETKQNIIDTFKRNLQVIPPFGDEELDMFSTPKDLKRLIVEKQTEIIEQVTKILG